MKGIGGVIFAMLFLVSQSYFGQIEFTKNPVDYGVINANSADYLDVAVKNVGSEKVFIFRADVDQRFQIQYSNKTIAPDSTVYIRVLFTPDRKGPFREKIPIHFSCYEEPKTLEIIGFTEEIPSSSAIACPSFEQQNINTTLEHDFTVLVIDEATSEPLAESQVKLIQNGALAEVLITRKDGTNTQRLILGYYYFVASHEGYESKEVAMYVNRKNNRVVIPLRKMEVMEEIIPEEEEEELLVILETPTSVEEEPLDEEEITEVFIDENDPYPDFSLKEYKPNNLVFLVDVSSSMIYGGKLDLLKASMIELTSMLRDVDKITLVAYASKATVLMETTSVADVDSIIGIIEGLEASGMTSGGKGLELAYTKACSAFIPEGNNQIIMATDGAFNMGEENVNKLAKKYNKKGVTVSVVGIKNSDNNQIVMRQLSEDGGGTYLNIKDYEFAKKSLVNEIRKQSRIQ